jgi:hypothetical protein
LPTSGQIIHRKSKIRNSSGGADGIRTHYLFNAIEALSQLSYSPELISDFRFIISDLKSGIRKAANHKSAIRNLKFPSGADGTRTHYLFSAIEALSQLSYGPLLADVSIFD